MSYYGDGGGGGWGPPPHQLHPQQLPPQQQGMNVAPPGAYFVPNQGMAMPFQQPPPGTYFHPDPSGYSQGMAPYEFMQQTGYTVPVPGNSFAQPASVPMPTSLPIQTSVPSPVTQPQYSERSLAGSSKQTSVSSSKLDPSGDNKKSILVRERTKSSAERSHSPRRRRSRSPDDRFERRAVTDRGRDHRSDDLGNRQRDRSRNNRGPSPEDDRHYGREQAQPQMLSDKFRKSRREEHELSREKEIPPKGQSNQSSVDIDALLKDERLRNVLFAGISKATAKLEQTLKQDKDTKDNVEFVRGSKETKSQLFPSASTGSPQKPRSILKRRGDPDENSGISNAFNNLSALEKTLQILRGKSDGGHPSSSQSAEQPSSKSQGALGSLVSYDDDNEEEAYLYGDKGKPTAKSKTKPSNIHPFWSVDAVAGRDDDDRKEPDAFEKKEKMFEEWRQSIQKSPERPTLKHSKASSRGEVVEKEPQPSARRFSPLSKQEGSEELDSTVQNILQSIGFDFDLSQRMQQLARKKKFQEEEKDAGISNQSASFLDKRSTLSDELRASLLQSGNDLSKIDSLLQEARAIARPERTENIRDRSLSPVRRRAKSPGSDRSAMMKEMHKRAQNQSEWSDHEDEPRQRRHPRRKSDVYEDISPKEDFGRTVRSFHTSDSFNEGGPRDEYFYPDKDPADIPPGVPLLTSYSSRQRHEEKNEDLTGGLLKMRVENFRVMSRPVYDDDNEELLETRRVILSAKSERVFSRSPSPRDSRSPSWRGNSKRLGSPLSLISSKERRIISSHRGSVAEERERSPGYMPPRDFDRPPISRGVFNRDSLSPEDRRRYKSPSPQEPRLKHRPRDRSRSRSPDRPRRKSPKRFRSRSPIRGRSRSPVRGRSRSPMRARSPRRRRSRSHSRPRFRDMRSPVRLLPQKDRSPVRRTPPRDRRRQPVKRSPERKDARKSDPKPVIGKEFGAGKKDNVQKAKNDDGPQKSSYKISKMTDEERKAYLQKMLAEKSSVTTKKSSQEDLIPEIIDEFEKFTPDFTLDKKTDVISQLFMRPDEHQKILKNVRQRFARVITLKSEIVKLRKQQNELMRKSQRSGKGVEDPDLSSNEKAQTRVEDEIARLSSLDFDIDVSKFSLEPKSSESNKPTTSTSKLPPPSGNLITVPVSDTKKGQSGEKPVSQIPMPPDKKKSASAPVAKDDKKKKPVSDSKTAPATKKSTWTSVAVQDELPEIKGKEIGKANDKKGKDSQSSGKVAAAPKKKVYYEYIDGGSHFCRHCRITCTSLNQFLQHLHGKKHTRAISNEHKPWDEAKSSKDKGSKVGQAQSRRVKGSEMMLPVVGCYCSICKVYCGDLTASENHLKTDAHYNKYLDYIRDNPKYEKNLLLEKSGKSSTKKNLEDKTQKAKEKKTHLRVKPKSEVEKEEEDAGEFDNIGSVDMEIDEEDKRNDDIDVASKVPKMVPKPPPFVPPPPPLPPPEQAPEDSMETIEDADSLDKFLTMSVDDKQVPSVKEKKKAVVASSLINIKLVDIPIPVSAPPEVSTVKSLRELQDEERKAQNEEKRMMGIDVDAEEEKPLAAIKKPPVIMNLHSESSEEGTNNESVKPSSVDNLFAKLKSKNASQKLKPKAIPKLETQMTAMEIRIQHEIKEKLDKEKEKLAAKEKQKLEKEEGRERRREEKRQRKMKLIYGSSESSSEESDFEESNSEEVHAIPLPEVMPQVTPIGAKLPSEAHSATEQLDSSAPGIAETEVETIFNTAPHSETDSVPIVSDTQGIVEVQSGSVPGIDEIPISDNLSDIETPTAAPSGDVETQTSVVLGTDETSTGHVTGNDAAALGNIEALSSTVFASDKTQSSDVSANNELQSCVVLGDVETVTSDVPMTDDTVQNINVEKIQDGDELMQEAEANRKEQVQKPITKSNAVTSASNDMGGVKEDNGFSTPGAGKKGKSMTTPSKKRKVTSSAGVSSVSDLFGVFTSSVETVSQEAKKKLKRKGSVRKRGRGSKVHQGGRDVSQEESPSRLGETPQELGETSLGSQEISQKGQETLPEEQETSQEDWQMMMEDFVVLSEVTGEEDDEPQFENISSDEEFKSTPQEETGGKDSTSLSGDFLSQKEVDETNDSISKSNEDDLMKAVDDKDSTSLSSDFLSQKEQDEISDVIAKSNEKDTTKAVDDKDSTCLSDDLLIKKDEDEISDSISESNEDDLMKAVDDKDSTSLSRDLLSQKEQDEISDGIAKSNDDLMKPFETEERQTEDDDAVKRKGDEKDENAEDSCIDKVTELKEPEIFPEIISDEQIPSPAKPVSKRGGKRGRGRKSGGRGRGRGKRSTRDEEVTAPGDPGQDEQETILQEDVGMEATASAVLLQADSIPASLTGVDKELAETEESISIVIPEMEMMSTPQPETETMSTCLSGETEISADLSSVGKCTRSGRTQQASGRVTRSRVTKKKSDTVVEMSYEEQPEAALEEVQTLDTMTVPSPTTLNTSTAADAQVDVKDGSDSDATITEDQDVATLDDFLSPAAIHAPGDEDAASQSLPPTMLQFDECQTYHGTPEEGSATASTSIPNQQHDEPATTSLPNTPRDPPMSGVVSEIEDPECIIMDVDDDKPIAEPGVSECEGLPTSGLGLDLEDVTGSIAFSMEDEDIKTDFSS